MTETKRVTANVKTKIVKRIHKCVTGQTRGTEREIGNLLLGLLPIKQENGSSKVCM